MAEPAAWDEILTVVTETLVAAIAVLEKRVDVLDKQDRQQGDWVPPGTYVCLGRDGGRPLRLAGCGFFVRSRLTHGKANSDRIMGRPAGNGEVPTPERTMSPDNGTVEWRRQNIRGLAIRHGRNRNLTAAPRTKKPASQRRFEHSPQDRQVAPADQFWPTNSIDETERRYQP